MDTIILKKAIEKAEGLILKGDKFKNYSGIYPFTTENIQGYFKNINFDNANVLTVCSSGDHALNSALYGAKKVDTFDRNILTEHYMNLKISAISKLNYNEYLRYFLYYDITNARKSKSFFEEKMYLRIRDKLTESSKEFWDGLYSVEKGYNIRDSKLFKSSEVAFKMMRRQNPYLRIENYYKLKEKLSQDSISFVNSDLYDINSKIKDKEYKYMFLSNISSYIDSINGIEGIKKFKKFVVDNLSKNLTEDGKIFLGYIYRYKDLDTLYYKQPCINNSEFRKEVFSEENFETIEVESARFNGKKDLVLSYRKNK